MTAFPAVLTPNLQDLLGRSPLDCGLFARMFRDAGHEIPKKLEAEQAFVLHWSLLIYFEVGDEGWPDEWQKRMQAVWEQAKANVDARQAEEAKALEVQP